jgi:hypothetical protein
VSPVAVCVGTLAIGVHVSMYTLAEKHEQVGVPTLSCQMPRVGNGVGIVTRSWPEGRSAAVSCTVGRSGRDSVALNAGLVGLELGAQGLGLSKKLGLVHGDMVIMASVLNI